MGHAEKSSKTKKGSSKSCSMKRETFINYLNGWLGCGCMGDHHFWWLQLRGFFLRLHLQIKEDDIRKFCQRRKEKGWLLPSALSINSSHNLIISSLKQNVPCCLFVSCEKIFYPAFWMRRSSMNPEIKHQILHAWMQDSLFGCNTNSAYFCSCLYLCHCKFRSQFVCHIQLSV